MEKIKPRVVIVFKNENDYKEMKNYSEAKGLDMKNFFMWLAKNHMTKYPLKTPAAQAEE